MEINPDLLLPIAVKKEVDGPLGKPPSSNNHDNITVKLNQNQPNQRTNERMNITNKRTNERTNEPTNERTNERTNKQTNKQTNNNNNTSSNNNNNNSQGCWTAAVCWSAVIGYGQTTRSLDKTGGLPKFGSRQGPAHLHDCYLCIIIGPARSPSKHISPFVLLSYPMIKIIGRWPQGMRQSVCTRPECNHRFFCSFTKKRKKMVTSLQKKNGGLTLENLLTTTTTTTTARAAGQQLACSKPTNLQQPTNHQPPTNQPTTNQVVQWGSIKTFFEMERGFWKIFEFAKNWGRF